MLKRGMKEQTSELQNDIIGILIQKMVAAINGTFCLHFSTGKEVESCCLFFFSKHGSSMLIHASNVFKKFKTTARTEYPCCKNTSNMLIHANNVQPC